MEIRWLADALADVRDLYARIAADNPAAAGRVVARSQQAANALDSLEARGRLGRVPNTRELVVAGASFIVPYRARGEVIEILRVLHGARQWPATFEEPRSG